MKEKQERVKDAVAATKAALEEGIVPGGGVVLLEAARALNPKSLKDVPGEGDQATGVRILQKALEAPIRKLAKNAGMDDGVVVAEVLKRSKGVGLDVMDGKYKDMIKTGIIDPAKVTRSALQNAVSVATMILTTEGLITDLPEEKKETPPTPGGMPGMGM